MRPILATYRVQLTAERPFGHAAAQVERLADLGISHLHLSPVLAARPGTTHFYDVADHSQIDPVLGGEEGLRALAGTAHDAGMGLIGDVVPHHMGAGPWSPLWDTLLREGRSSPAAASFDIDWETPLPGASDKVILPVLTGPYGDELAAGRLRLAETAEGVRVTYGEESFPLSAETVDAVERAGASRLEGKPGDARSWGRMHSLLEQQHYRLVSWRAGRRLVNYRRHLHRDAMAALRVEDEPVFEATHALLIDLVREGVFDGLRIDHVDGLADPLGYLRRLREAIGPDVWVVVDKLATPAEPPLPPGWPVQGTTGQELLRTSLGMQVDPHGLRTLRTLAAQHGGLPDVRDRWRMTAVQLDTHLGPDLRRLARVVWDACQDDTSVRDVDYRTLLEAVSRTLVALPVYRTTVDPTTGEASEADTDAITQAVAAAAQDPNRRPIPDVVWRYLTALLTGEVRWTTAAAQAVTRFQQLSGPVRVLGIQERFHAAHQAMVGACEWGCDPDDVAMTVSRVHEAIQAMPPSGLRATTTHDTRHSEDVRMRLAALTGLSADWSAVVDRIVSGTNLVEPSLGVRLLQLAVGIWPITDDGTAPLTDVLSGPELGDRLVAHAIGVARAQGVATSHVQVDEAAEADLAAWVRDVLDPDGAVAADLRPIALRAAEVGMASSLSQTLLRITVPGVPDTFQGTERWDDAVSTSGHLRPPPPGGQSPPAVWDEEVAAGDAGVAALWAARRDGRVKHWVLRQALRARAADPETFGPEGGYEPIEVTGRWSAHLVAFRRTSGAQQAVAVCPRMLGRVTDGGRFDPVGRMWADTEVRLPGVAEGASWHDALSGHTVEAAASVPASLLLADLPVALLLSPRPQR